jgi:hypothetical protein
MFFVVNLRCIFANKRSRDMDDIETVISGLSDGVQILQKSLQCAIWCVIWEGVLMCMPGVNMYGNDVILEIECYFMFSFWLGIWCSISAKDSSCAIFLLGYWYSSMVIDFILCILVNYQMFVIDMITLVLTGVIILLLILGFIMEYIISSSLQVFLSIVFKVIGLHKPFLHIFLNMYSVILSESIQT